MRAFFLSDSGLNRRDRLNIGEIRTFFILESFFTVMSYRNAETG